MGLKFTTLRSRVASLPTEPARHTDKSIFWMVNTLLWTILAHAGQHPSLPPGNAPFVLSGNHLSLRLRPGGSREADSTPWQQSWRTWPGSKLISTSQWSLPNGTWPNRGFVYNSLGSSGKFCGPETWEHLRAEAADTMFPPHESWGQNWENGI